MELKQLLSRQSALVFICFPLERATKIAVKEVRKFLEKNESIEKVIFVCFDEETYSIYKKTVNEII